MKKIATILPVAVLIVFMAFTGSKTAHAAAGEVVFIDPYTSEERTLTVGEDGCVSAEWGVGITTTRLFCIVGSDFTLDPPGDNYGPYISFSPSGGGSSFDPDAIALIIANAIWDNVKATVGEAVILLAVAGILVIILSAVVSWGFKRTDDAASARVRELTAETDRLLADDDAKGGRFRH